MKRLAVELDEKTHVALRMHAAREQQTLASIIRIAINNIINTHSTESKNVKPHFKKIR